jgi:Predicted membrane protein
MEDLAMHWIWEGLIGLLAGVVAKLIMPGKDPGGIIITMLLGIAGSLVATYLGSLVGWYREGDKAGFIMSVLGAVILLAMYRLFRKRSA